VPPGELLPAELAAADEPARVALELVSAVGGRLLLLPTVVDRP
jgi:hypothetical protein